MALLGLIPARSGSKGVPGKNVRALGGKPLIAHTIEASRQSRIDRVILSTDSADYADVAKRFGAEAPFLRPASLAEDTVPAIRVVQHCLDWLAREDGWVPDAVFYLQPTSPFRTASHLDAALDRLTGAVDSVMSVAPVTEHPLYAFRPKADGRMAPWIDAATRPERRQDLPPAYAANDAIMLSHTAYLQEAARTGNLVTNIDNFSPLIIEPPATLDINREVDFLFAEFLLTRQMGHA